MIHAEILSHSADIMCMQASLPLSHSTPHPESTTRRKWIAWKSFPPFLNEQGIRLPMRQALGSSMDASSLTSKTGTVKWVKSSSSMTIRKCAKIPPILLPVLDQVARRKISASLSPWPKPALVKKVSSLQLPIYFGTLRQCS